MLILDSFSAVVSADDIGPLYTVPTASPGDDTTYDETYRVLASNDEDLDPDDVSYGGYFESDFPYEPVSLGVTAHDPSQVLRYAATTDLYRTQASELEHVPYADQWVPYSEWDPDGSKISFWRVHELNAYDGPPDNSGEWFVRTTNQYGDWRPVYNAEVTWNSTAEEPELANPDEALVHDVQTESTIARVNHVTDQYRAYSDDPTRAAVPMNHGTELFPTFSGASVPLRFGRGNADTVNDAWVGVANVADGAWYRGRYVVGDAIIAAYVPHDYRAVVPEDFSRDRTCTKTHTHTRLVLNETTGNWTEEEYTETHQYPKTQWAEFELVDSEAEVTNVTLDAPWFSGNSSFIDVGDSGVWLSLEPGSTGSLDFPPGDYNLTAQYTVRNEIRTDWGVTSNRCNEWDRTTTRNYTVSRNYTVPVTVTTWDAEDLQVDVFVADSPGRDRVNIFWAGNQDLPANPWEEIELVIGEKVVTINSPWRFYDVSRNTEVQVRTGDPDDLETHPVTHSYNDRWPAIHHSVVSVANVTIQHPEAFRNQEYLFWEDIDSAPAMGIPATDLPDGIDDTDNAYPTTVYSGLVGDIRSSDLHTAEPVSMDVTSVFGGGVGSTTLTVEPMATASLTIVDSSPSPDGEGHEMTVRLVDSSDDPIQGREITVAARTEQTYVTDSDGEVTFSYDGYLARVIYEGDVWYTPGEPFYDEDQLFYVPPVSAEVFAPVGTIGEYLAASINNTLLVVEWIALGLFALWWVRRHNASRRGA
ncbi:hypothetical protein [Halosimplex halobium]|uniref:hypothetical protein n=1 Tax=Halosimplex halobium TaxID=3396618 RepID=UPI003F56C6B4